MRLIGLTKDKLDSVQLDLYNAIAFGPRASGTQHFPLVDETGALTGPFGIMLHLPALGRPLEELGAAICYRTSLSGRVREIAILSVAAATDSEFERYAHERIGRAVGLADEELSALARGEFRSSDQQEEAAYRLCTLLNEGRLPLTDDAYTELREVLGETTLIELPVLVGYYRTLSQLLHVFDAGIPSKASIGP